MEKKTNAVDVGTRRPAVAGRFYPGSAAALRRKVQGYLDAANVPAQPNVRAVIAPHAGYVCSGSVAGVSFKALLALPDADYLVYLMGPAHWSPEAGVALSGANGFATPLGEVAVASDSVATLVATGRPYAVVEDAHASEHCLEVELPFLQLTLPRFRIVPMLFGQMADPLEVGADLVHALSGQPHRLIVVSSDLSHYHAYDEAVNSDTALLEAIVQGDVGSVQRGEACGLGPIRALMHVADVLGWKPEILDYRNSGDTCGPKNRVVGYGAVAYTEG